MAGAALLEVALIPGVATSWSASANGLSYVFHLRDAKWSNGEPILDVIDWEYLSERLGMTGAEIKATALAAAFMARGEGTRIGMRHVLAAAQREMAKQGLKLRMPLQEASA